MKLLLNTENLGSDSENEERSRGINIGENASIEAGQPSPEGAKTAETESREPGENIAGTETSPPIRYNEEKPEAGAPEDTGEQSEALDPNAVLEDQTRAKITEENLEDSVVNLDVNPQNASEIVDDLTEISRLNKVLSGKGIDTAS